MARLPGKAILLRPSVVMAVLTLAAGCAIFGAVALPAAITTTAAARQLPIYSVERAEGEKLCAISFDAAWGNEDTQKLIDILAEYNVKTTFFVVGDWVDKYPESVKALADAGHEVMSHSDHHDHYNTLSREQIVADINASCQKIEAVTGSRPTLIRCPYGEYDDHVISAVRSLGMEPIQWDADSLAWQDYDAGDAACGARQHCAVSQRGPPHAGGAAVHFTIFTGTGVHGGTHRPADLPGGLHHRPYRTAVFSRER